MKMSKTWPVAVVGCLLWSTALAPATEIFSQGVTHDMALQVPRLNSTPGPEYADSVRMFQGIPAIERAPNGRLWAAWYGGGVTEDKNNYIILDTSGDDGQTWQRALILDPDRDGPVRAFDPCLWFDPDGKLWLFWAQEIAGNPGLVSECLAISTSNPSQADAIWSVPRTISRGVMLNKPIVAADGRWLLPIATWSAEASARVVVSLDRGVTFRELGAASIPDRKSRNADEHMLVERKDGSLWMLVRGKFPPDTKNYTGIGESVSTDGGKTWTDVKPSSIPHPIARFFVQKLISGNLLLVRHDPPGGKKDRSHLTAFLSEDDGRTWKGGLLLDERVGISYPDGVQAADGRIYIIYDFDRGGAKQILMATFTEEDVLGQHIVSPAGRLRMLINQATGVNTSLKAAATKAKTSRISSVELAANTTLPALWDPQVPFPGYDAMLDLPVVTHVQVERAQRGGFHYLHEATIAWHNGSLYAGWANHPRFEANVKDELLRGRSSTDGGLTWGPVATWVAPPELGGESYNHPALLEHQGKLWGFFTRWEKEQPRTEIFTLDAAKQSWQPQQAHIPGFIPFTPPRKMRDGNWIISGELSWFEAAVGISHGDDFTQWDVVQIPRPDDIPLMFPETTLLERGDELIAICRPKNSKTAPCASSKDCGRTWTKLALSNFPLAAGKPLCGRLSTGQQYLVTDNLEQGRGLLSIAVTAPGGDKFCRIWKIRHQQTPVRRLLGTSDPKKTNAGHSTEWSYPAAVEHDGKLYVIYTQGKEDCALSIIPLTALAVP
ncbi:MAG: hypothetical protein EPN23_09675 [Verrucomicrobia bacterium]|nr:MAG: hypothetical protein EPN23_09675 [Verrucomicrobiota bacterium]